MKTNEAEYSDVLAKTLGKRWRMRTRVSMTPQKRRARTRHDLSEKENSEPEFEDRIL